MKQLMKKGIPPELARDWVGLGCVEANMPGKMSQWSSAALQHRRRRRIRAL